MPRKRRKTSAILVWRGIRCRVSHQPDWLGTEGWSHIEIEVLSDDAPPLPITETGYRSHFLDEDELAAAGGLAAYFRAWLDREAMTKAY